jgi:thiol:disulfide interchange protein DsbC
MRKYILIMCALLFSFGAHVDNVFAFAKGEHDCSKCHTLTEEGAKELLSSFVPDVKILGVKPGPITGVWEVTLDTAGKKGLIYVDFSKKYLISGSFIDAKTKKNITKEKFDSLNKVDVSEIPLDDALLLGKKDAKIKVIVFDDPD